jgi:hypothetical protein
MPKTTIEIQITIQRPGQNAQVFVQRAESEDPAHIDDLWPAIVTGLELIMSKIHRAFFPTDAEKAEDANNAPPHA